MAGAFGLCVLFTCWSAPGECALALSLVGPAALEFVEGEPVVIPLTLRNTGEETARVRVHEDYLAVTVERLGGRSQTGRFVIRDEVALVEGFRGTYELAVPPGEARTHSVYLGYWGVKRPAPGVYRVTIILHDKSLLFGPGDSRPLYRYSGRFTVTRDPELLRAKLRALRPKAIEAEKDSLGPYQFVEEIERYDPLHRFDALLWFLETRLQELERVRHELLISITCSLEDGEVDDPEPVVRRLAALRNEPRTPSDFRKLVDLYFSRLRPLRHMPKLEAAVKEHFGIELKGSAEMNDSRDKPGQEAVAPDGEGPSSHRGRPSSVAEDEEQESWLPPVAVPLICAGLLVLCAMAILMIRRTKHR